MSKQYEILPESESGDKWSWRLRSGDKVVQREDGFSDRGEALNAAREDRGDKTKKLYDEQGDLVSEMRYRGPEKVLLLRADGSLHSEIDHEMNENTSRQAQYHTLVPIEVGSGARELNHG